MVISHGSEPGPFYLPYNYRSDPPDPALHLRATAGDACHGHLCHQVSELRFYGISAILPVVWPVMISRCASATSASG